jgi:hypothetical protein
MSSRPAGATTRTSDDRPLDGGTSVRHNPSCLTAVSKGGHP